MQVVCTGTTQQCRYWHVADQNRASVDLCARRSALGRRRTTRRLVLLSTYWITYQILSPLSRRLVDKIPLQGFARCHARAYSRDHSPGLRRDGRSYRKRRSGPRSRPYVHIRAATCRLVQGYATAQSALIAPGADGISRTPQALPGQAVLGAWIFLNHIRQRD